MYIVTSSSMFGRLNETSWNAGIVVVHSFNANRVPFVRFLLQKIWFSSRSANPIWSEKNHEDDRFPFLKIPSSSVFVLALKFSQISQNSAKSCVVLLQKEQLLVPENHDSRKNKSKYQSISNERACEKAD